MNPQVKMAYWTPLHIAITKKHFEIVKLLVENEADVNVETVFNWTPLHFAIRDGHLEIIKLLITNGAKVNLIDTYGRIPPLELAKQKKNSAVIEYLESKGAK